MPAGWDSYAQAVAADGPVGWWRFAELLAGSAVTAGGQDPQNICFDASSSGNANANARGSNLTYGSAVVANAPSLLLTQAGNGDGGSALFPSLTAKSVNNIITGGASQPAVLQPTAAISVEAWCKPAVITGGATQVLLAYGTDASTLAAYNLNHTGSTAINHTYVFSINIGGSLKTATAAAGTLVAGTTNHVVGTYDGVNVRIFVNGVLQGTTAATGAISYASIGAFGLAFGNDPSNTDANIQGSLDEIAIYNFALSATRIAYHFREGSTLLPFVWNH